MVEKSAKRKPAGLRDVAARAGVSMGTVSNVLNRPETVPAKNRERVERAIEELQYVGSYAAVQLRSGRSRLLGVVVPDIGNPFWGDVLRGIESVTDEWNLFPVVSSTHQDLRREDRALRSFLARKVDGLLLAPSGGRSESLDAYVSRGVPAVLLEHPLENAKIPVVGGDNVAGGRIAAGALLEAGFDRVVLVNGPAHVSWSHERKAGALLALADHGLPADRLMEVTVPDLTAHYGEEAVEEVLKLIPSGGAIMCGNDLVALGVLRRLTALGRLVPSEFSLVGYDDVEFARVLSPALTTVRQPSFDMGRAAAQILVKPTASTENVQFAPELVRRGSIQF